MKPLEDLIPKNMRLRQGGMRSAPRYVPADGHLPGEQHVVDRGGKRFIVKIVEELRHGQAPGVCRTVTMAKVIRIL